MSLGSQVAFEVQKLTRARAAEESTVLRTPGADLLTSCTDCDVHLMSLFTSEALEFIVSSLNGVCSVGCATFPIR